MSAKHTQGPWSLSDEDSPLLFGADGAYIAQVFSRTDCDIGSLRPNHEANARLIAAAPDLLEALQDLCDTLGECGMTERARAAIAKAEGRE